MAGPPAEPTARAAGDQRRVLALAVGLAITLGLAYLDYELAADDVVIATVVLGPLACALIGGARETALVGALATALALTSGAWNDNFEDGSFYLRAGVVALGALVAALAAARRDTVVRDRVRFAVLSGAAEAADGTRTLEETADRVTALIVPSIADLCIVDVVARGELRRLAVRGHGTHAGAAADGMRLREPTGAEEPSSANAVASSRSYLLESVEDDLLRQIALDDEDLALLRSLHCRSTIIVPLIARGRALGALTLISTDDSGRSYGRGDLEFAGVLSGRVALALDNAGLYAELETTEAQLSAALSALAEAVTMQHAEGALVYANEAAARMLGFESPQELLAAPVADVIARFDTYHEDGSPLSMDDLPGRKLLAGEDHVEPLVTRTVDRETGAERWRVTKATPIRDRRGRVTLVVNVIDDITEVKRAERTQRLLAAAGEALASSLDYEQTLQQVAELAVPDLADWCAVSMPDGRGLIRSVAVAHRDAGKVEFARRIAERYPSRTDSSTGAAQVIRDGAPQLLTEITDEIVEAVAQDREHAAMLRELGMRTALIVPMTAAGRTIGTLSLIDAESGRVFTEADVELAGELARRAGAAVENARLYTERSAIAGALQTGLLPDALPEMTGWAATSLYRPAGAENWVGGDFYDIVAVAGGWLVIVGDVAGRGADAAALTALARHTLRSTAKLLDDPLDAVAHLNAELLAREGPSLCTVAAALLAERDGEASAEVVCAGHPNPLLLRPGRPVEPVGHFGPMLGAYDGECWRRATVPLAPGAVLVLYTDGVLDTVGEGGERFGEERLQEALSATADAGEAVDRIASALAAFEVGEQADDTAVLAVQRLPVATTVPPAWPGRAQR